MSNWPESGGILIDCNVFKHHWDKDPVFNGDGHVALLLASLVLKKTRLRIDNEQVIRHEYHKFIIPLFKAGNQTGIEVELLRYWMEPQNQDVIDISAQKPLKQIILKIIHEPRERADRTYVCVSFCCGSPLITNDLIHIVVGPPGEKKQGERRTRLINAAKQHRHPSSEILRSSEAHARIGEA